MALEIYDFRDIVIKADAANTSIPPVRLSAGDHDGRRIVFELWDGAESVAATGMTAMLTFKTSSGASGYANMSAVSGAQTATWAVAVPVGALVPGTSQMAVKVMSGNDAVCTRIFDVVIEPSLIDGSSPEAQDALADFEAAVQVLGGLSVPIPVAKGGTGSTVGALSATDSLSVKSELIDQTDTTATTAQGGKGIYTTDAGGRAIGVLRGYRTSLRDVGVEVGSMRNIGGSTMNNILRFLISEEGKRSLYSSEKAIWSNLVGIDAVTIVAGASQQVTFQGNGALIFACRDTSYYIGLATFWESAVYKVAGTDDITVTKSASSRTLTITNGRSSLAIAGCVVSASAMS